MNPGGSGYCRREGEGYAMFAAMEALSPDFFVASGDMVYTDSTCPTMGPGGRRNLPGGFPSVARREIDWTNRELVDEVYRRHWRYNRADPLLQRFLAAVPIYAQWDDHEIVNDSGGDWDYWNAATMWRPGYANIAAAGRQAFFDYWPIARNRDDPSRSYRSFQWGRGLEIFLLDTRSYRSRNDLPDTPENRKTMLGGGQLEWLKEALLRSRATWKIVSTGVPLSAPTGGLSAIAFGRDGWASGDGWGLAGRTGFERELLNLVACLDENDIQNVVFIAGDAHRALTIRYVIDVNRDGRPILFHELVAGPLAAGVERGELKLDTALNPTPLYAEDGILNFGYVRIGEGPEGEIEMLADVRGLDGEQRPGSALRLTPERSPRW